MNSTPVLSSRPASILLGTVQRTVKTVGLKITKTDKEKPVAWLMSVAGGGEKLHYHFSTCDDSFPILQSSVWLVGRRMSCFH